MWAIGIMQGRLVPPEPGRFQSFPKSRWRDEFALAKQAGLDFIEWIYDAYGENENPLRDVCALAELTRETAASGIKVPSVCADYFMDFPLVRCTASERELREAALAKLIQRCGLCSVQRIVLPFVDISKIETAEEKNSVLASLHRILPAAVAANVELHLESSMPPSEFAEFLARIEHPLVRVNYDSGNSSSLGYRPSEEFAAYGARVGSVHIKDRILGGGTVALGTGDADFPALAAGLRSIAYRGQFTLQVARPDDNAELEWTRGNIAFVRRLTDELK